MSGVISESELRDAVRTAMAEDAEMIIELRERLKPPRITSPDNGGLATAYAILRQNYLLSLNVLATCKKEPPDEKLRDGTDPKFCREILALVVRATKNGRSILEQLDHEGGP